MRDNVGHPFDPSPIIQKSVANVINNVTFGRRYDYLDPHFLRHLDILDRNMRIVGNSAILNLFPFLKNLPGDLFGFKRLLTEANSVKADFLMRIAYRIKSFHGHGCFYAGGTDSMFVMGNAEPAHASFLDATKASHFVNHKKSFDVVIVANALFSL